MPPWFSLIETIAALIQDSIEPVVTGLDWNKGVSLFYNFFVQEESNFGGGSFDDILDSAFLGEQVKVLSLMLKHF